MCKELFFKRSAHTMTQEIEIEFKNIVTEEEFNTLCKSFSIEVFTKQVNHYFETPDFSLKAGSALRIRHKGKLIH